jgi:prepilin-type N-terminal cleavage/methylation domain-containing protein
MVLEATVKADRDTTSRTQIGKTQRGFSLIEVMVSMVILVIGLVSMLGVFGIAMAATQTSQQNGIAKQLANEAIESILTARETANVTWNQIQNSSTVGGIYLSGFQPLNCAGVDGIVGTADDAACGPQIMDQPGPTGVVAGNCPGPGPDVCTPLTNFQRQISITPVFPPAGGPAIPTLRAVTITIQYTTPQSSLPRQYVLNTFISQYR